MNAPNTALSTLTSGFAARFGLGENQQELIDTLKSTAFKGATVNDAQMTALMLVAQQYNLNPWTREIYAFPDKGGIVPVVGVDGWSRIMNDHPQFDGMEFKFDDESCTCIIYRKDRSHAISATEYLAECRKENSPAWKSHPRRMLRHKAMIQAARLAFGFGGIFDQDEAERIIEVGGNVIDGSSGEIVTKKPEPKTLPAYTDAQMEENEAAWQAAINSGKTTPQRILAMVSSKFTLSSEQAERIRTMKKVEVVDAFVAEMNAAEQQGAKV